MRGPEWGVPGATLVPKGRNQVAKLHHEMYSMQSGCRLVVGPQWQELRESMLTCLKEAINSYWERFTEEQQAGHKPMVMAPVTEVEGGGHLPSTQSAAH